MEKHIRGREATAVARENNDVRKKDTESMEATKSDEPTLSKGAQRMRLHRRRRRRGERLVRILLSAPEIDGFVRKGYLDENSRDDEVAIRDALEWCVLNALSEPATSNTK